MPQDTDSEFYDRADAHINLSNDQISPEVGRGKVSASMLFGAARFNAWVSATRFASGAEMMERREETLEYFTAEYRKMLEENFDDYVSNFDRYMTIGRTDV